MQRKSLSDILHNDDRESIARAWDSTSAAPDFAPLPKATYVCHLVGCELFNARTRGTPGVKLTFQVIDGEHAGRKVWHDIWLTPAAMPRTKRQLEKFGVTSFEQLDQPLPRGIRCRVKVTLRTTDDGTDYNEVRGFDVVGIDPPETDPFAPAPLANGQPPNNLPPTATAAPGDSAEPNGEVDASFNPEAFEREGRTP